MTVSRIYTTAPDIGTRSVKEEETFALLDRLGIEYERVEHEPAMTIEACQDIDRILDTPLCKNLFLTNSAKTQYYLLLLPGDKAFHTREVADQIGSTRLSFGSADKMQWSLSVIITDCV
ncbi:MAG: YbaK/EbsC family protein, partial [Candidatus Avispirillum sp.]